MYKQIKRLTAFMLIFCMLSVFNVFSAEEEPTKEQNMAFAVDFLRAVSVLPEFEGDGKIDLEANVSRGELSEAISKAYGYKDGMEYKLSFGDVSKEHKKANYIMAAVSLGLMNGYGDGNFLPDYPVKYEEAIKACVSAVGYAPRAELKGGYPIGYVTEASRLKMLKNVKGKMGEFITIGNFAMLLSNTLDTCILEVSEMTEDKVLLEADEEKTLLIERLEIYKTTGLVKETEISSLTGISTLSAGRAKIGDKLYQSEGSNIDDWLGYLVTAYYKEGGKLLFAWPEEYEITVVKADNILDDDKGFSTKNFVYMTEDGAIEEAEISTQADLIYNGVSVGSYKKADMLPQNGRVKLLDNNSDEVIDVIFVEDYEDMIVGKIDASAFVISDEEDGNNIVKLNPEKQDEYFFKIESNGEIAEFSDIVKGDAISVYESKNQKGVKFIRICISKESIDGELTGKSKDDKTITVDAEVYDATPYFFENFDSVALGEKGTFLLNEDGKIVGMLGADTKNYQYGYLLAAEVRSAPLSGDIRFKIIDNAGELEIFTAAEHLNVDGSVYKGIKEQKALINGNELEYGGSVRQLVRYKLNSAGELKNIDTVNAGSPDTEELTEDYACDARYYYSNVFGMKKYDFMIDATSTYVFVVPSKGADEADQTNEDLYFACKGGSFLTEGNSYNVAAYDTDDSATAGAVVVYQDMPSGVGNQIRAFMVDKISTITDENGTEIIKMTGFQKGQYAIKYVKEPLLQSRVKTFKTGDLLTLVEDMGGEPKRIRKLFDAGLNLKIDNYVKPVIDNKIDPFENSLVTGNGDNVIQQGTNQSDTIQRQFMGQYSALVRKDGNKILLSGMNDDGTPDVITKQKMSPLNLNAYVTVTIYNAQKKMVEKGSISDLDDYTYVRNSEARIFVHTYAGVVKDIFVFDFSK